jgi:hypothetical protein
MIEGVRGLIAAFSGRHSVPLALRPEIEEQKSKGANKVPLLFLSWVFSDEKV